MVQSPPQNPRVTQSPLMFAPQPPTQSSLHLIKKEKIVSSSSSSAYPKQDMFLFLNPRGQYDFTKTHLQSKELPDMNYASNTRKRSTFLERCVSKRHGTAELYSGSFDRSVKECTYGWER
ncbi:hypothetical protein YC2023_113469 [Brassica napus]